MISRLLHLLAAAGIVVGLASPAHAQPKTDLLVMRNGDHITGEVVSLRRGLLTFKTDEVGTLSVDWVKVVSLSTLGQFDVALGDGRRYVGRLDAAAGGEIAVITPTTTLELGPADIVTLTPIRSSFFQKIDGSLDVGASYAQSSEVAQWSFNQDATYRRPSFSANMLVSLTLTQKPDEDDSVRGLAQFGYTRFRPNQWFVTPFALIESNRDLGFELRATGALAIGRYLHQSNRSLFMLAGGGAVGRETPVDGDTVTNVDALVTAAASVFTYDYPHTSIDVSAQIFPSLNDAGRVRLNTTAKFRRELLRDVYLTVSGYETYDNRPVSENADTNDVGYSLSFGWSF
jgi:uncharacterized protein DUF481